MRKPTPFLLQAYATAVCVLFVSGFRTLGEHRWDGQGERMTLEEQLLDSVNYPHWPLLTELWDLFPSSPEQQQSPPQPRN